jgi:hypothetical protein
MKAVTVSVNFADLLSISLPRNAVHFERIVVASTPQDSDTARVVAGVTNADLFTTDAFYRDGRTFGKWLALEEALDRLGRDGWICVFDADVVMPPEFLQYDYRPGFLYSPYRRMIADPREYRDGLDWNFLHHVQDKEFAGYCQVFHADDEVLRNVRPWYGTDWKHAGGGDSDFQFRWPPRRLIRLPFHVLHLGQDGRNWMGRVTPYLDGTIPPEAAARAAQMSEMMRVRQESGGRHEHEKLK